MITIIKYLKRNGKVIVKICKMTDDIKKSLK